MLSCTDEQLDEIQLDFPFHVTLSPTVPKLIYPSNNLVCTNFDLEFEWRASRSELENSIAYTIEIASDNLFSNILFKTNTAQTIKSFNLEKGTTYFWRVKAIDEKGYQSTYSRIYTFFTEPEAGVNTIPNTPVILSPTMGASVSETQTTLSWNATDSDGDPLLFDIYFGESNPPQLFAENQNAMTLSVQTEANKTYYWRVVAKDDKQGIAMGRVWNFRTE
ncbi:hypothetical protein GCM10022258_36360 [Aquimarina gracilis]